MSTNPLPPGKTGLPLIGETLTFAKDPFAFVADRVARHGRVSRTHLMFEPTAILSGPETAAAFIDPDNCTRVGSQPPHVARLFIGESLPAMDPPRHLARKQIVLAAFGREALASYVPAMQRLVERAFEDWCSRGPFRWSDDLEALAVRAVCQDMLGLDDAAALRALHEDYKAMGRALGAVPLDLPGTTLRKGLKACDRLVERLSALVREHREQPGDDGLSRVLAAEAEDGTRITDDEAVRELHHLIVAGYIVFCELVTIAAVLAREPEIRKRLEAEIESQAPEGALSVELLAGMPYLARFLMETKRVTPVVPFVMGRARRDFDLHGHRVPRGWRLLWAVVASHRDADVYPAPDRFDPDRFDDARAEHRSHPEAFAPQGPGPMTGHKCAGFDYSTLLMGVFAVVLLRGYEWTLDDPRAELDTSVIPPVPRDGLRARVWPRGDR